MNQDWLDGPAAGAPTPAASAVAPEASAGASAVGPSAAGSSAGGAVTARVSPAGPTSQRPDAGTPARRGRDRGAATVWLLAAGLALVAMGVAGAAVGTATVARHRAQTAADLGALAGAVRAGEGTESACARAAEIVTANEGRLTTCRLDGFDLTIAVEVSVRPVRGIARTAHASARAGPLRAPVE